MPLLSAKTSLGAVLAGPPADTYRRDRTATQNPVLLGKQIGSASEILNAKIAALVAASGPCESDTDSEAVAESAPTPPGNITSSAAGVGALTDADLAAEAARLASLLTKQQLATQSRSIASNQPRSLLTLFQAH